MLKSLAQIISLYTFCYFPTAKIGIILKTNKKSGGPMHEAPAIMGSGEDQMYAAFPLLVERLL